MKKKPQNLLGKKVIIGVMEKYGLINNIGGYMSGMVIIFGVEMRIFLKILLLR